MRGLIINHNMSCFRIHEMFKNCDEVYYTDFDINIVDKYDYYILSGGEINISDLNDIVDEKKFLSKTTKPIFGICLGMQIICIINGLELKDLGYRILEDKIIKYDNIELNIRYNHGWFVSEIPKGFDGYVMDGMVQWIRNKNILAFQGHPEISKDIEIIKGIFKQYIIKRG